MWWKSKKTAPKMPDITMDQAWDEWFRLWSAGNEVERGITDVISHRYSQESVEVLKQELRKIEDESKKSKTPLTVLRREIMNGLGVILYNKSILDLDEEVIERTN